MFEPALLNEHIELLAANFKSDEINELGKLLYKDFDSNKLAQVGSHISMSPRKSAQQLVNFCREKEAMDKLVKLTIEIDESRLMGHTIQIDGLEGFLNNLARSGYIYDFKKRKLQSNKSSQDNLVNWGILKDNKKYELTVMSLDITGNSELVRKYGVKKMEKAYFRLWEYIKRKIDSYDGKIWSQAGDGGLIGFAFKGQVERAVQCALDIQLSLPIFNLQNGLEDGTPIALRLGLSSGKIKFLADTGRIVSDVINYAAHLEKSATEPGKVSISGGMLKGLDIRFRDFFVSGGDFEGSEYWTTGKRLDGIN